MLSNIITRIYKLLASLLLVTSLTGCNGESPLARIFSPSVLNFCLPVIFTDPLGTTIYNYESFAIDVKANGHYRNNYESMLVNGRDILAPSSNTSKYNTWTKVDRIYFSKKDVKTSQEFKIGEINGKAYLGNNKGVYSTQMDQAIAKGEFDITTDSFRGYRVKIWTNDPVDSQIDVSSGSTISFTLANSGLNIYESKDDTRKVTTNVTLSQAQDSTQKIIKNSSDQQINALNIEYKIGNSGWLPLINGSDTQDSNSAYTNTRDKIASTAGRIYLRFKYPPNSGQMIVFIKVLQQPVDGNNDVAEMVISTKDPNQDSAAASNIISIKRNTTYKKSASDPNPWKGNPWVRLKGHQGKPEYGYGSLSIPIMAKVPAYSLSDVMGLLTDTMNTSLRSVGEDSYKNLYKGKFSILLRAFLVFMITIEAVGFVLGIKKITQLELVTKVAKYGLVITLISPNNWEFFHTHLFDATTNAIKNLASMFDPLAERSIFGAFDRVWMTALNPDLWSKVVLFALTDQLTGLPLLLILLYIAFKFFKVLSRFIMSYMFALVMLSFMVVAAPFLIPFILFDNQTFKTPFTKFLEINLRYIFEPFMMLIGIIVICDLLAMQLSYVLQDLHFCYKCAWPFKIDLVGSLLSKIPLVGEFASYWAWEFQNAICIWGFMPWGFDVYSDGGFGVIIKFYIVFILPLLMAAIMASLLERYTQFVPEFVRATTGIFLSGGLGNVRDGGGSEGAFKAADLLFSAPFQALGLAGSVAQRIDRLAGRFINFNPNSPSNQGNDEDGRNGSGRKPGGGGGGDDDGNDGGDEGQRSKGNINQLKETDSSSRTSNSTTLDVNGTKVTISSDTNDPSTTLDVNGTQVTIISDPNNPSTSTTLQVNGAPVTITSDINGLSSSIGTVPQTNADTLQTQGNTYRGEASTRIIGEEPQQPAPEVPREEKAEEPAQAPGVDQDTQQRTTGTEGLEQPTTLNQAEQPRADGLEQADPDPAGLARTDTDKLEQPASPLEASKQEQPIADVVPPTEVDKTEQATTPPKEAEPGNKKKEDILHNGQQALEGYKEAQEFTKELNEVMHGESNDGESSSSSSSPTVSITTFTNDDQNSIFGDAATKPDSTAASDQQPQVEISQETYSSTSPTEIHDEFKEAPEAAEHELATEFTRTFGKDVTEITPEHIQYVKDNAQKFNITKNIESDDRITELLKIILGKNG
ncbi:hypothetical protein [Rickettsiales endosymbiont of Stachyamoeba lipophora]|uniref:hypothetical protein n=1 Tax=Rickettsiales endosymbiont of Stachyamoeba lipophora TaxID=2486578 RepID=UPI000F6551D4|nr:hypothetical protein [Rickettsiales endosymbiont of Stachyamoeba lipophora]AZL15805.1 hypothetical protein EF513_04505 [Rickettsiales endosymbiont of Stachyamoeba lipophora]